MKKRETWLKGTILYITHRSDKGTITDDPDDLKLVMN